jgi:hypothetical protein
MHVRLGIFAAALAVLALTAGGGRDVAQATLTFSVNVTADVEDPLLSDNNCDIDLPGPGPQCTLRAAVSQSNFTDGLQIINVPAGTYNLTLAGSLRISDEVAVNGAGAEVVFVDAQLSTTGSSGTWRPGSRSADDHPQRHGARDFPGAVAASETPASFTLTGVDISGNTARTAEASINESTLTLVDSVVRDNSSQDEGGHHKWRVRNLSIKTRSFRATTRTCSSGAAASRTWRGLVTARPSPTTQPAMVALSGTTKGSSP